MPWYVGIDENGLGPQLGPLLVTAVLAEVLPEALQQLQQDGSRFLHARLDDSKALVAYGRVGLAEAWAREVCACWRDTPTTPEELVNAYALQSRDTRLACCPESALQQCWSSAKEAFEADESRLQEARTDLLRLREEGIRVHWSRSQIVCVRSLNLARHSGMGRFQADLQAMEQLILAARQAAPGDLEAVCGKVGGLRQYLPALTILGDRLALVLSEERACSSYRFPGIGTVHFRRDADSSDPLVALASLIGKYLRELLMKRIVKFYQRELLTLGEASGYNDKVTDRFVQDTQALRSRLGIPDLCFRREQKTRE